MASLTLNEDVMKKLQVRANKRGLSVPELIADFAEDGDDDDDGDDSDGAGRFVLTPEIEAKLDVAVREIERGEFVSAEEAMRQLRAQSRR